jgi:hypothetical protein
MTRAILLLALLLPALALSQTAPQESQSGVRK